MLIDAVPDVNKLVKTAYSLSTNLWSLDHGPEHWQKVARVGLRLIEDNAADPTVVFLFALFHDLMRENDHIDPQHGYRGAMMMEAFYDMGNLQISPDQYDTLFTACRDHTNETYTDDITCAVCWDSDRLNLMRVGMKPDPDYLNTKLGKHLASIGWGDHVALSPLAMTWPELYKAYARLERHGRVALTAVDSSL